MARSSNYIIARKLQLRRRRGWPGTGKFDLGRARTGFGASRRAGFRHYEQESRECYRRNGGEGQEGNAVAGMHHDHPGNRVAERCAYPLERCDGAEADIVSAGPAHEVGYNERCERSEYAGADTVKELHRNQPFSIVGERIEYTP